MQCKRTLKNSENNKKLNKNKINITKLMKILYNRDQIAYKFKEIALKINFQMHYLVV